MRFTTLIILVLAVILTAVVGNAWALVWFGVGADPQHRCLSGVGSFYPGPSCFSLLGAHHQATSP